VSRPRFLADLDFNERIVSGVLRKEPSVVFERVRDWNLQTGSDAEILEFAAANGLIVTSHDVNTMRAVAVERVSAGLPFAGLALASQSLPVGAAIEQLILVWAASDAEEWTGIIQFLPL
jgi:hypothetical protein